MCTSCPRSAPGRSRANGPMRAHLPTCAPSRCENERIVAPSSTVTPGPKTTFGSIVTSFPNFVCVGTIAGLWVFLRRARLKRRHTQPTLQHSFGFGELHLGVDAAHVILRGFDRQCL